MCLQSGSPCWCGMYREKVNLGQKQHISEASGAEVRRDGFESGGKVQGLSNNWVANEVGRTG